MRNSMQVPGREDESGDPGSSEGQRKRVAPDASVTGSVSRRDSPAKAPRDARSVIAFNFASGCEDTGVRDAGR